MSDTEVLQILITDKNKINTHYKQIINKNNELKIYLENRFNDSESLIETIYRLQHNLINKPKCLYCQKTLQFNVINVKFRDFCSVSCSKKYIQVNNNFEQITDDIIKQDYLIYNRINKNKLQLKYIREHNYENYLTNRYVNSYNLSETIYRICNNVENKNNCCICGKPVRLINFSKGFDDICSDSCKKKSKIPEITDEYLKSLSDYFIYKKSWSGFYKADIYLKNKFGDNYRSYHEAMFMLRHDIIEIPKCLYCGKFTKFNPHRYYGNYRKYCSDKCKRKHNSLQLLNKFKLLTNFENIQLTKNNRFKFINYCDKHKEFTLTRKDIYKRLKYKMNLCPYCEHIYKHETLIETKIRLYLEKNHIKYIQYDRVQIYPKELDFYLPDYKIGIECNGIYWHCSLLRDDDEHFQKFKLCQNKNIQLLTFWETDILNHFDIVKDILNSKLKLINNKIYARKCFIKQLTDIETIQFLNNNYLRYDFIKTDINLGLVYNDQLVMIMSFCKNDNDYELKYFCSKLNYRIIGGFSKLLTYFFNKYNYDKLIIKSDNQICSGDIYSKFNFKLIKIEKYKKLYFDENTLSEIFDISDNYKKMLDIDLYEHKIFRCSDNGYKIYELK